MVEPGERGWTVLFLCAAGHEALHVACALLGRSCGADLRVAAAIGGLSKYEQIKDLKAGSEVRLFVWGCGGGGERAVVSAVVVCGLLRAPCLAGSSPGASRAKDRTLLHLLLPFTW